MAYSVENICGLLVRSRLLSEDEVKKLYQRWLREGKSAARDAGRFNRWLVANKFLTEYQVALVARGQVDNFFVNDYKILERVGRGRMAGVFKAQHKLGAVVAIKVLPPARAKDNQLLARFQREARLALRLRHANVVRTFQVGEISGLQYIVMEYLEGETLEELLKRKGKLSPALAVPILYQALLGLQHLHEQWVVHRDLNPANLMLVRRRNPETADGAFPATVKILDIGLGRDLFDESAPTEPESSHLTEEGVLMGTPDYLAPEQARDAHAADIRSDIYSLGCVLYHALAGQPPFPDAHIISQMVRHAKETPRPLREFNSAVADSLQQVVNVMMAKEPKQRYPTPQQAAEALRPFLAAGGDRIPEPEIDAAMSSFLMWVESENGRRQATPPASCVAAAVPLAPMAAAAAAEVDPEAQTVTFPFITKPTSGKQQTASPPLAYPVAQPKILEQEIDVELIPQPVSEPGKRARGGRVIRGLNLTRRDLAMIGAGAGGVLIAVLLGALVAWLVHH